MGTIGDNIKNARTRLYLTQAQLAQMAGITKAAISRYEAGLREPRVEHLRAIANALDVSVGYLEGYESINSKRINDAISLRNPRLLEEVMGLPSGSINFFSAEEEQKLKEELESERIARINEREHLLAKIKILLKFLFQELNEEECDEISNLVRPFSKLNREGRQRAIEHIEELTEIPKYKKDPPQD